MSGEDYIIGIDEAGRGSLAGPVFVGIIKAPANFDFGQFQHLDDSKKMTETRRVVIFEQLKELTNTVRNIQHTAVYAGAKTIDTVGINSAIQQAINRGLRRLMPDPKAALVYLDGGLRAPKRFSKQKTVIGGDGEVSAISLASVLAKVARDNYMKAVSEQYLDFNFTQHKGYGTPAHREALTLHGAPDIHRQSFLSKILEK
jgi:ribonuclease HII